MTHTKKPHLLEVLGVFCPYRPMLGPTPGHVTCHRASSPETDPLLQPRRDERAGERSDELFLAVVINNNTTANRTPNWETTVRLPSVRAL